LRLGHRRDGKVAAIPSVAGDGVFVTNRPVVVHSAARVQATKITGDGKRGAPRVYDGPRDVAASGANV
jgi:hypothetical protein